MFTLFRAGFDLTGLAQITGDNEIVTDRPDITESAIVVPTASLQAENGATWIGGHHATGLDICQSLLRLGQGYESRLALPSRFEGLSLGLKCQIGPVRGFDVSLKVAASLPVGSTPQYSHRVDPFLKIPWSREVGHGWSIGGMQSVFWLTEDGRRNLTWEPTFVLERELSHSAYAFEEYGGDYPQRGRSKLRRWLFLSDRSVVGKEVTLKILLLNSIALHSVHVSACGRTIPMKWSPAPLWRTRRLAPSGGACTTQNIPTPGFKEYWKLTLTFDQQSATQAATLQADYFYDMFRSQSLEDGSSTLILPLWGDFVLKPDSPEYLAEIRATAPLYETRPHEITISVVSNAPLTIEFLFTEHSKDFNVARRSPSAEWMIRYLESVYRLGTNRPDGFSK